MTRPWRWDPCIAHSGAEVVNFINDYFAGKDRNVLVIAGAGFDPRAGVISTQLAAAGARLRGLFFQEIRPKPSTGLVSRANNNASALTTAVPDHEIVPVEIFGTDLAVVGGRNVASFVGSQTFEDITDVVVDVSALSVGTSFPTIRLLVERIQKGKGPPNLHLFVAHDPALDGAIQTVASDSPGYVHGFKGGLTLDKFGGAAKLWLPQLATGKRAALGRLHEFLTPHDTCPILPFPARDPRLGDALAEEFLSELESAWSVDTRDIVYADEQDPLDLYRTILRLDDLRKPVFSEVGGSVLVLSPLGSKVMALGALMAALERDLPVAYLEALGYDLDASVPTAADSTHLVHIWLEGDAYPQPRPPLYNERTNAS
ncbi:hypothetical protein [Phyllobacterium sophorae]|uniref:Uncharacterized protein n=1 Tax=Phyllobacterium sophorae TaxID=1520277 RepID=A0A2P7B3Q9_9HYPH|nr:hypothetical protein [Phyllobacterium sophorae]PSH61080.1 hypothetical protein CU103_24275 [Phyllobacterium sophorae]